MYKKINLKNYLFRWVIICGYLLVQRDLFFVKNIFIIISSMNNDKTKNSRFFDLKVSGYKKFKVFKIYLAY